MRPLLARRVDSPRCDGSSGGRPARHFAVLSALLSAVAEGFAKAEKYEMLVRHPHRELAGLRLTDRDLPRLVMFDQL